MKKKLLGKSGNLTLKKFYEKFEMLRKIWPNLKKNLGSKKIIIKVLGMRLKNKLI